MELRGQYATDVIGKCKREVLAFRNGDKSRIDRYLLDSETYKASIRGIDLEKKYSESRADQGMLCWHESKSDRSMIRFPVFVDEKASVFKQANERYFGCLSDVRECLYRKTATGALIRWDEGNKEGLHKLQHTQEEIDSTDSSKSTFGTTQSSRRRVGQAHWRKRVSELCGNQCVVTGCRHPRLLRASHIKRWESGTTKERLDENNGLLLAAHIDAAFEVGLISFSDNGKMLFSQAFSNEDRQVLGIPSSVKLKCVSKEMCFYLEWHRKEHGFV